MIFCNIAVKVRKFASFFLLKLLDSIDEVVVSFFFFFCVCLVLV